MKRAAVVRARAWAAANAPLLVLGLVVVAASALLLAMARELTFYQDTWAFLMHRQGSAPTSSCSPTTSTSW